MTLEWTYNRENDCMEAFSKWHDDGAYFEHRMQIRGNGFKDAIRVFMVSDPELMSENCVSFDSLKAAVAFCEEWEADARKEGERMDEVIQAERDINAANLGTGGG